MSITRILNWLANFNVGLSLSIWVFAYLALPYIFGDVFSENPDELKLMIEHRAFISSVLISLMMGSLLLATWLSGYLIVHTKWRAIIAGFSCVTFVSTLVFLMVS